MDPMLQWQEGTAAWSMHLLPGSPAGPDPLLAAGSSQEIRAPSSPFNESSLIQTMCLH